MEELNKFIKIATNKGLIKKDKMERAKIDLLISDKSISPKLSAFLAEITKVIYKITGGNKK